MLYSTNKHTPSRHAVTFCGLLLLLLAQPYASLRTDSSSRTHGSNDSIHGVIGATNSTDITQNTCLSMADMASMTCLPVKSPNSSQPQQQHRNQSQQQQKQEEEEEWPQLCGNQMTVMSIGTVHAPHRQKAQAATFGLRVPIVYVTESVQPECVFCEDTNGTTGIQDRLHLLFQELGDLRWSEKPLEWHCAQHRQLLGVQSYLHGLNDQQLPLWLLIIDDDTYVRLTRLLPILVKLDPDKVYVFGDEYKRGRTGFAKINGGSGFLLSRGTLRALRLPAPIHRYRLDSDSKWVPLGAQAATAAVSAFPATASAAAATVSAAAAEGGVAAAIAAASAVALQHAQPTLLDICVQRMMGGSWCRWHSDWIFTRCVEVSVGSMREHKVLNGFGQFGCKPDLRVRGTDALTCHYVATLGAMTDMQAGEACGKEPKKAWWQNRYAWTVG